LNGVRPVVRYLIVCNDVVLEPKTKEVTIIRLISTIRALQDFPVRHPVLCVFVELTECPGTGRIRIQIVQADTGRITFRTRPRSVEFGNDSLEVVGVRFRIRNCTFPAAGLYLVQFWYNDESIAEQPILLR
jgi:hypothetical protein